MNFRQVYQTKITYMANKAKMFALNNLSLIFCVVMGAIWSYCSIAFTETNKISVFWIGLVFICANIICGQLNERNTVIMIVMETLWFSVALALDLSFKSIPFWLGMLFVPFSNVCGNMYINECRKKTQKSENYNV